MDISDFSNQYGDFEQELRIEALILPKNQTAIIRIDKTIAIDDNALFNCEDDNDNWVGSGCTCPYNSEELDEEPICPEDDYDCMTIIGAQWLLGDFDYYCDMSLVEEDYCSSETFDLSWTIIDDVGEDGVIGDPGDEDGDGNLNESRVINNHYTQNQASLTKNDELTVISYYHLKILAHINLASK